MNALYERMRPARKIMDRRGDLLILPYFFLGAFKVFNDQFLRLEHLSKL